MMNAPTCPLNEFLVGERYVNTDVGMRNMLPLLLNEQPLGELDNCN